MAKILESGGLDSFIRLAPIPKDLYKHTLFVWDNKLYVVGGSIYYKEKGEEKEHLSNIIYYSKINQDGTLNEWKEAGTTSSDGIYCHQTALIDGFLYIIGGKEYIKNDNQTLATNKIWYGLIEPTGNIKEWNVSKNMDSSIYNHTAITSNKRVYVIARDKFYCLEASSNGNPNISSQDIDLKDGSGIINGETLFYFTGTSSYSAKIKDLPSFTPSPNIFPYSFFNHSVSTYKDFIYIIGGKETNRGCKQ